MILYKTILFRTGSDIFEFNCGLEILIFYLIILCGMKNKVQKIRAGALILNT